MTGPSNPGAGFPAIATRDELLQRLSARPVPIPALHLTPEGPGAHAVRTLSAQENEKRIAQLQSTMERAQARLATDHSFARLEGQARTQFTISR